MNYHAVMYFSISNKKQAMSPKIAIIYHSGLGHTHIQTELVRDEVAGPGHASPERDRKTAYHLEQRVTGLAASTDTLSGT